MGLEVRRLENENKIVCSYIKFDSILFLLLDVKSSADIRHDELVGDKHRSSRVSNFKSVANQL